MAFNIPIPSHSHLFNSAPAPEYWNKGSHGLRQFFFGGGAHGEHVEREPITEVWGQSPQRGPGAELFSSRTCNGQSKFVPFAVFSAIHYNKIERCKIRAGTPQ